MSWSVEVHIALDEFVLDVELTDVVRPLAIIGPNGSGKSTLLRVIAGALTPGSGEIVVDSVPLFSSKRRINLTPQQRHVGYVPQGYGLFPHLSALDNVAFGLRGDRDDVQGRARAMLAELDVATQQHQRPKSLSGGEKQRVALARALVTDPRILLLDEPLAALDVRSRRATRRLLAAMLVDSGRATAVATHDVRDVVALDAEVCVLEAGKVVQRGSIRDLEAAPVNAFVEEFVGLK